MGWAGDGRARERVQGVGLEATQAGHVTGHADG
jgi:hypothetical protein